MISDEHFCDIVSFWFGSLDNLCNSELCVQNCSTGIENLYSGQDREFMNFFDNCRVFGRLNKFP